MTKDRKRKDILMGNMYWFLRTLYDRKKSFINLVQAYYPNGAGYDLRLPPFDKGPHQTELHLKEYQRAENVAKMAISKWPPRQAFVFNLSLSNFLEERQFGAEWRLPISTAILTGYFYPPTRNYLIENIDKGSNRLMIEIGPHTSIHDLRNTWEDIQGKQKEIWPSFRPKKYTKKSIDTLFLVVKSNMLKIDSLKSDAKRLTDQEVAPKVFPETPEENLEKPWDQLAKIEKKQAARLRQSRRRYKM